VPGHGLRVRIVVAQQGGLMAIAGVGVDIGRATQAQVVETQQGMALGVVLAALAGSATPVVGAFFLVWTLDEGGNSPVIKNILVY